MYQNGESYLQIQPTATFTSVPNILTLLAPGCLSWTLKMEHHLEKTSELDQFFQQGSAERTQGRAAGLKCAARLQKDSLNECAGDQGKPLKIPLGPKGTCCLGLDLCSPSCPRLHLSLCPPCILLRFYHISSSRSWKSAIIAGPVRLAGERGRAEGGGQKARQRKGANGVRLNWRGTFFDFG